MKSAVLFLFLLGSIQLAHAGWERVSDDTIRFSGPIQKDSYKEYISISQKPFKTLHLQSPGGVPNIALKIAEDVLTKDVEIVIDKYCFSACANYLALAGKRLTVPCGSLIGWHGSITHETDEQIKKNFVANDYSQEFTDTYLKWIDDIRQREQQFYRKVGINSALLIDSVRIPIANNVTPIASYDLDEDTGSISVTRGAVLWLPTKSTMDKYGVKTNGFCPVYDKEYITKTMLELGLKTKFFAN